MKTVGQSEFGMDRRTTATLRRGVLQIGIAAGSHSYRHVLLTVLGQYLSQSGRQQNLNLNFNLSVVMSLELGRGGIHNPFAPLG